jgi:hypothetical protein
MPRNSTIQSFILVFFFVIGGNIFGQLPISGNLLNNTGGLNADTSVSDTIKKSPKTKKFRWYPYSVTSSNAWNLLDTFSSIDTTLGAVQLYTRESRSILPFANLGISGTPSNSLFLNKSEFSGIQIGGLQLFQPYAITPKNFQFHRVSQPFSEFKYSQGANGYIGLEALHTQNLSKTWNIAIDYHTITNGEVFVGSAQDNLIRNIGLGSHFLSINKRFEQQLIFSWNRIRRVENAGLGADSVFYGPSGFQGDQWGIRTFGFYQPRISSAKSFNSYTHHQINNRYLLNTDKNIHLESQINWLQHKYDFEDASTDTQYYGNKAFHSLVGSNDSSQWHRLEMKTGFSKSWCGPSQNPIHVSHDTIQNDSILQLIRDNKIQLPSQRIYFNHVFQNADYQQFSIDKSNVLRNRFMYAYSHGFNAGWMKRFQSDWHVNIDANYFISGYAKNSFDIQSQFRKKSTNKFYSSDLSYKYQPVEISNLNFLSNHLDYSEASSKFQKFTSQLHWSNTFNFHQKNHKTLFGFTVGQQTNPIVFLNHPLPKQLSQLQFGQLQFQWTGHFQNWYFHASAFAQRNITPDKDSLTNLPNLGLPLFYGKLGLAYQNTLFKKAIFYRIGTDIQYISSYNQLQYRIDAAQYFTVNQSNILGNYPIADIYALLRIQTIDIFFKYEHCNEWIVSPIYNLRTESTFQYPIQPARFRFGFTWKFWN